MSVYTHWKQFILHHEAQLFLKKRATHFSFVIRNIFFSQLISIFVSVIKCYTFEFFLVMESCPFKFSAHE